MIQYLFLVSGSVILVEPIIGRTQQVDKYLNKYISTVKAEVFVELFWKGGTTQEKLSRLKEHIMNKSM
jgi:hypothetical protein